MLLKKKKTDLIDVPESKVLEKQHLPDYRICFGEVRKMKENVRFR